MHFSPEKKIIKITETFSNRNGLIKIRTENHRNNDNNNSEKRNKRWQTWKTFETNHIKNNKEERSYITII